jgi:CDP-diacylglycerol--glycerol-3-phosphate 3-phosphatidyltransferase
VGEPPVERPPLTFRRLTGLDRSGPPPPQTRSGAPWRVWTVPNAIGIVRLALIPAFLAVALAGRSGTSPFGPILFAVIAWTDYADGIAARLTGQYSRFGALLDPVVDRLLVIAGVVACWYHDLLPRWALALLVARELFVLVTGRVALARGVELRINWWGRLAVWPVMSAIFFALCGLRTTGAVLLYVGLAMALVAAALYVRDGRTSTSA